MADLPLCPPADYPLEQELDDVRAEAQRRAVKFAREGRPTPPATALERNLQRVRDRRELERRYPDDIDVIRGPSTFSQADREANLWDPAPDHLNSAQLKDRFMALTRGCFLQSQREALNDAWGMYELDGGANLPARYRDEDGLIIDQTKGDITDDIAFLMPVAHPSAGP